MNVNKVIVIGRLGKDPEYKTLPSGSSLASFSLAVTERWTGKDGQKQEATEWINVKVFGKQADVVAKFLGKGQVAYVEGSLQTKQWEDKDGNKRSTTEVKAKNVQFGPSLAPKTSNPKQDLGPEPSFDGEEIPF
jgi:single-strand DNA-binding protein